MSAWETAPWRNAPRHFHPSDELWQRVMQADRDEADFVAWLQWNAYTARQRFDQDVSRETKLYMVAPADGSRFKIGLSAQPYSRITNLEVGAGVALKLIAVVPAKLSFEKYLHGVLDEYRVHGEWFDGSPRVMAVAGLLVGIEQACFDMESGDDDGFVPLFEDTLGWLLFPVEEAIGQTERNLRAEVGLSPDREKAS